MNDEEYTQACRRFVDQIFEAEGLGSTAERIEAFVYAWDEGGVSLNVEKLRKYLGLPPEERPAGSDYPAPMIKNNATGEMRRLGEPER